MREGTTSRVTVADRPYDEFYDFYSVSLENFGSTLVQDKLKTVLKDNKILHLWTVHQFLANKFTCEIFEARKCSHHITYHEGTDEYRYYCTLSLMSVLDGGGWLTPHPGCFTPRNSTVPLI